MHYIVFGLLAIIILLAWNLHHAWGEIDDLYEEIDELKEETDELERIAKEERAKATHYKTILHESEFVKLCRNVKEAAS